MKIISANDVQLYSRHAHGYAAHIECADPATRYPRALPALTTLCFLTKPGWLLGFKRSALDGASRARGKRSRLPPGLQ